MPRKGVTGHDEWVIAQALATALVATEQLPPKVQPKPWASDKFDWFALCEKHLQPIVFLRRPRDPCQCRYFRFAFILIRELPRGIRRAWARAITAVTVRPRSAAMSNAGALEIMSFRSRSSSSEVQAFALFIFFVPN
jgi:hypothetical protein